MPSDDDYYLVDGGEKQPKVRKGDYYLRFSGELYEYCDHDEYVEVDAVHGNTGFRWRRCRKCEAFTVADTLAGEPAPLPPWVVRVSTSEK